MTTARPPEGGHDASATPVPPDIDARIRALPCWHAAGTVEPLPGGMTNHNYRVRDGRGSFVVRLGEDLPLHGVLRVQELAAARAAHAVGLSPEVVYAGPGVMVSRYVDGRTLQPQDLRDAGRLPQVVELVRRCHHDLPRVLPPGHPEFRVFDVIHGYGVRLQAVQGQLLGARLGGLLQLARGLEAALDVGDRVFGHNDLLAGNFLDDGARLWLIDWDYAGFNTALFDLANLSANNGFSRQQAHHLLALYDGTAPDATRMRALHAMQAASMVREVLWGAVSHHHARVQFDFAGYTHTWLNRLAAHGRVAG